MIVKEIDKKLAQYIGLVQIITLLLNMHEIFAAGQKSINQFIWNRLGSSVL